MPVLWNSVLAGLLATQAVVGGNALNLDTYEEFTIPPGSYSDPLDVDLTPAKEFLGLLRVDMTWQIFNGDGSLLDGVKIA